MRARTSTVLAMLGACVVLAWQAQAAFATSGKVTVVKVNAGGAASDSFTFTTSFNGSSGSFTLVGGAEKTFTVECNASSSPSSCVNGANRVNQISEQPTPGYDLQSIVCRHRLDNTMPTETSPLDDDTTVSGGTIDLEVFVHEWVKCWVTNAAQAPAIGIEKSGPTTANAGDLVPYTLTVSNPGPLSFAATNVAVSDALCQQAPTLTSANGDATPATLDPGDSWTYACSVQTAAGQSTVHNTATVTATDDLDRDVTATDEFDTALTPPAVQPPGIQVLPNRQVPGRARLHGPSLCLRIPAVQASVTGREIAKVTFYVDGKRARTVTRADALGRWRLRTRVRGFGTHRVRAVVQFTRASGTATKTLRLTFSRCRAAVVRPQFTG